MSDMEYLMRGIGKGDLLLAKGDIRLSRISGYNDAVLIHRRNNHRSMTDTISTGRRAGFDRKEYNCKNKYNSNTCDKEFAHHSLGLVLAFFLFFSVFLWFFFRWSFVSFVSL